METSVLHLGYEFRTEVLAQKAQQAGETILSAGSITPEARTQLLVLNAGLDNFLESKYVVPEPEKGTLEAWVQFSETITDVYRTLNDLYPVFVHSSRTVEALKNNELSSETFKSRVPMGLRNEVNWKELDAHLRRTGHYVEMFLDREVYFSNIFLP